MLDYIATDGCRMVFLRDQLDDPAPRRAAAATTAAGSRCHQTVSDAAVGRPRGTDQAGVSISPRRMWPTALANLSIDLKGKIADGAEEGRAIARLTDLGYGQPLRDLFRPVAGGTGPGAAGPGDGHRAHRLAAAREGIVYVESATRPTLTADFADGLSRFLGIPVLGRARSATPTSRRARVRRTPRSGWQPSRRATLQAEIPRLPRCCWSTTWSSPAGP